MRRRARQADNIGMSSSAWMPIRSLPQFAQRHLPQGRTLPEAEWQRRHRGILALLWVLAATLPLYGLLQGHAISIDLAYGLGLLAFAALASRTSSRHAASSAIASFGLCLASAITVHLANGAIEAHFMFFVMIIVISLYEDWRAFLIAFGFVVAHHGLMGAVARDSVYSHAGNPWVLALIHGGFIAAAGIAALVSWRLNESLRHESRRAGDRAQESDARFRSAFEDGPLGMALVEMSSCGVHTVRQVNRTLCRQFGHSESVLIGLGMHELADPVSITPLMAHIAALRAGDITVAHDELRLRHQDGHLFEGRISMSLVARSGEGGSDAPRDLIVQIEDVTERSLLKRELQDLADHDPLTGLVNRRRFNAELGRRLGAGGGHREGGAVILIDLDGFKEINDTLGHESGDELLLAVSAALREICRGEDTIARLGGDEFALLIGNATAAAARSAAERIVTALHDRAVIGDGATERRASASVGVVVYSRDTVMTGDQLLNDADLAMYEAKDNGGNRCAVYCADPADADGSDHAPSWPERIRRALDDEHMTLYAQPILDLDSGAITNFELLLRMVGPAGEIIPPGAFLPVAERRGMILMIDRWVIGEAVALLEELGSEGGGARANGEIRLHVNLSGRSLSDVNFMDFIRATLDGAGVDPHQLVFEITETAAIANVDDACRFLTELSELGCGIALDDFGAGFGSLHYLKNLPVDLLKIDGQFISNLTTNPDDLVVVESLIRMARGLRMRTAAEYVEDAATLQLIGDLGVDLAQGYHVGRPGPARQVIDAARSSPTLDR